GTLVDGRFHLGDTVEIQPAGLKGRIRGLQTHKTKRDVALPGSRVAVNLTGVDKDQVNRGDVVCQPGILSGTILLDASYRHLPGAASALKHNMEVKLFVGAAEVLARTRILGAPAIAPGQEGWLQLALSAPVAAARGDRFILRRPSPGETLGGGRILDPHPGRRHRRFRPEVIARLETLAQGTPADMLLQALGRIEPATAQQLAARTGFDAATADDALAALLAEGAVVQLDALWLTQSGWQAARERLLTAVSRYHDQTPLRLGMPREALRSRLRLSPAWFNALLTELAAEARLVESNGVLRLPAHAIRFSAAQQAAVDRLLAQFAAAGANTPSVKDARAAVGEEVYQGLVDLGELRQLNADVVYAREGYERLIGRVLAHLQAHGAINAAQVRDLLQTSRKYAIALLEHMDDVRLTRRMGDDRVLVERPS
ncbi:MAG: SelB C-terminal domain-containing protein, partial [Anaerolineales bacterium]|nr:SelB C-terminal domain-containing protein [Anaerolineales bacterium]